MVFSIVKQSVGRRSILPVWESACRMSQGQSLVLETDFESWSEGWGDRSVPDLIRKAVAGIDHQDEVTIEEVRAVVEGSLDFMARPVEWAEWEHGDYWMCFVLSVLGRGKGKGSKLRDLSLKCGPGNFRYSEWLALCVNLSSNSRVESLTLDADWDVPGFVSEAVRLNSVLKYLHLRSCNPRAVGPFLAALTPGLEASHSTTSITIHILALELDLQELPHREATGAIAMPMRETRTVMRSPEEPRLTMTWVSAIATMISKNTTLKFLALVGPRRILKVLVSVTDWSEIIIPALQENATLKKLHLSGEVFPRGKHFTSVLHRAFQDLCQSSNGALEEIELQGTALDLYAGQFKEMLRKNREYRRKFVKAATKAPICGRIVLCGYQHAGKTTLCETMVRNSYGSHAHHSFSQAWTMAWKKFLITYPGLRRFLFGSRAAEELKHRTRGVDIVVLRDTPGRTSLWDFAGQTEYYALHDYVFPDVKNSCFVYVCSPVLPPGDARVKASRQVVIKGEQEMKAELQYWMRFIASNSKPIDDHSGPPKVMFVLTNKDSLNIGQLKECTTWAKNVVEALGTQFHGRIALEKEVAVVNAHSDKDVQPVLAQVENNLAGLLRNSTEYVACDYLRLRLQQWSSENPTMPILDMQTFQQRIWNTMNEEIREALEQTMAGHGNDPAQTILTYLSEAGDIIFSRDLTFVVVNPRWFGIGVLGSLINAFGSGGQGNRSATREWTGLLACFDANEAYEGLAHSSGFVRRDDIETLLNTSLRTTHLTQDISADDLMKLMLHLELCFEEDPENSASRIFVPSLFESTALSIAHSRPPLSWRIRPPDDAEVIHFGRRLECKDASVTFLTPGFFHRAQVHLRNYVQAKNWHNAIQVDKHLLGFGENGVEVLVEYSGDIGYFVDILVQCSKPFAEALEFVQVHVVRKLREFCAEPQGCQGVLLEECVIRPMCVKRLDVCELRRNQAEKVSVLKDKLEEDPRYLYCWREDNATDYVIDLLEGEGSYRRMYMDPTHAQALVQTPADIATSFPRNFNFVADENWFATMVSKGEYGPVMFIRLYAKCEFGQHEVKNQPGRLLQIKGSDNIELVKYGANLVGLVLKGSAEFVPGMRPVGKAVDRLLQSAFKTPVLDVPMETLLEQFVNTGKLASSGDVIRALQGYLKTEHAKTWLSTFFDSKNGSKEFLKDFRLWGARRRNQNQVTWACDACWKTGRDSGALE